MGEREFVRTIEAEEGMGGGADFLLDSEMVVQRHLLKSCHHTLVRVHCKNIAGNSPASMFLKLVPLLPVGTDLPIKPKAISGVDLVEESGWWMMKWRRSTILFKACSCHAENK